MAAEQGNITAQLFLGRAYADGEGVPKDNGEAARWYCQAAGQGDLEGQYRFGLACSKGDGVRKDDAEAVFWLCKAAEQGHELAQQALAEMDKKSDIQSKPKVLVADDERVIADTLAIILNRSGYEASAVYTGNEAVAFARHAEPDLIISEAILPDINGIEAASQIREFLPSCKVLFLCLSRGGATAELLNSALAQGHEFGFIAKPAHPLDLLAWLKNPQPRKDKVAATEWKR